MSTPSGNPAEEPDAAPAPGSPAETPAEAEPSGALAPEEMAFAPATEDPAVPPAPETRADIPPVETRAETPAGPPAAETTRLDMPPVETRPGPRATDATETAAAAPAAGEPAAGRPAARDRAPTTPMAEPAYAAEEPAYTAADEPAATTPMAEPAYGAEEPAYAAAEPTAAGGEPAYDTLAPEEPAYAGAEEPAFDTLAPEDPAFATAVEEWPPLVRKLTLGQAMVLVAGILLFVFGFLPWYSDSGGSANAWSRETIPGLLLTATWVPLLSLAIVIFLALKIFGNGFPDRVLGFSWAQLAMVVGLFDVLITLGFLVANRSLGTLGSLDLGPGLILSFIASLVLLAGAVLDHFERGTDYFRRGSQRRVRVPRGRRRPTAPGA